MPVSLRHSHAALLLSCTCQPRSSSNTHGGTHAENRSCVISTHRSLAEGAPSDIKCVQSRVKSAECLPP